MIIVKVIRNKTGEPVRGLNVYISKAIAGGVRDANTNSNGEAHIDFQLPCNGKIVIDGKNVYEGEMKAYMPFYI
ncbi:MAG: hypothetical protein V7K50_01930 [Nostoc sp.]|uniref:hypothetical protein n=1 Tax=Nostoc sp. TaxID=1180 RepID=UPI002FF9C7F0